MSIALRWGIRLHHQDAGRQNHLLRQLSFWMTSDAFSLCSISSLMWQLAWFWCDSWQSYAILGRIIHVYEIASRTKDEGNVANIQCAVRYNKGHPIKAVLCLCHIDPEKFNAHIRGVNICMSGGQICASKFLETVMDSAVGPFALYLQGSRGLA